MQADKASLPFGDETMLGRTVRIVASTVDWDRIVVVAAANQELPGWGSELILVRDTEEYQGPLRALTEGFAALPPDTEAAFVTGCDTPLLVAALIEFLFAELGDYEAVVPADDERSHPLCAVYRTTVADPSIWGVERSMHDWLQQLQLKQVFVDELRDIDPELDSLRNVNTQEEYFLALSKAAFSK
jgi:molybdopterin-guanine dinucleotide biosynthesis protein A